MEIGIDEDELFDMDYRTVETSSVNQAPQNNERGTTDPQNLDEKTQVPAVLVTFLSRIYLKEEDDRKMLANTSIAQNQTSDDDTEVGIYWAESFPFWLFCEITSYLLTCVNIYIFISLILYHIRQGGLARQGITASPKGRKYSIILNLSMLLTIIFTLTRLILDLDTVWGRSSKVNCVTLKPAKIVTGFLGFGAIYGLFWSRQRIFYSHPVLKRLNNRLTSIASLWIFVPLFLLYLANVLYFLLDSPVYKSLPPNGCSVSGNMTPWYLLAGTSIFMQLILLALFVYPLFKNKKNPTSTTVKTKSFMKLIKNVFIIACLAVFFCITALCIITFVPAKTDKLSLFVIDFNLTLLGLFGLAQFVDWKARLVPCERVSKQPV